MQQFGLLGETLGHSFSPAIHKRFGSYPYALFEVPRAQLEAFIKSDAFSGCNVTIPYKQAVLPFCDVLSLEVQKIGSANTLLKKDGKLYAMNTDYFGFLYLVKKSNIEIQNQKCLVLGNGGVSLTVQVALKDLGAKEIIVISRRGENNYENLQKHFDANVIVNTTPVGMYPNNMECPIQLADFKQCKGVLDLIYNPLRTKLILDAKEMGIQALGGLPMLVAQAKKAAEIFMGTEISDAKTEEVLSAITAEKENLLLIGMPGSGKSFLGQKIAKEQGKILIDTDQKIVEKSGISIPEIFERYGEDYFRNLETEVLKEVTKLSAVVIATGGGVVTKKENWPLLRQNSKIIWVKRDVKHLATDGRPLSKVSTLEALLEKRKDAYAALADVLYQNEVDLT